MTIDKKQITKLFKLFINIIDELEVKQYENLLLGKGQLVYVDVHSSPKEEVDKKVDRDKILQKYMDDIMSFDNREGAYKFLADLKFKKEKLIELAQYLQVYICKKDTKVIIYEKIVESTIGTKLRTEAIKETDLKRK